MPAGAEELEKRLLLMKKEQKLIQEEAQQAVLQAAASQPAAMAGANVGQPAAETPTPAKVVGVHGERPMLALRQAALFLCVAGCG